MWDLGVTRGDPRAKLPGRGALYWICAPRGSPLTVLSPKEHARSRVASASYIHPSPLRPSWTWGPRVEFSFSVQCASRLCPESSFWDRSRYPAAQ